MSTPIHIPPEKVACPVCFNNDTDKIHLHSISSITYFYTCQVCDFLFTVLGERIYHTNHEDKMQVDIC